MNALHRIGVLWNKVNTIFPPSKKKVESGKMLPVLFAYAFVYAASYASVMYLLLQLVFSELRSRLAAALLFSLLFLGVMYYLVKSIRAALRHKHVSPTSAGYNLLTTYLYLLGYVTFYLTLILISNF